MKCNPPMPLDDLVCHERNIKYGIPPYARHGNGTRECCETHIRCTEGEGYLESLGIITVREAVELGLTIHYTFHDVDGDFSMCWYPPKPETSREPPCTCPNVNLPHAPDCPWKKWKS